MQYVLGFMFSYHGEVCLIHKKRGPTGVVGRYNGVGGKVRVGESNREAMNREAHEETGILLTPYHWTYYGDLIGPDYEVALLYTKLQKGQQPVSVTDEEVYMAANFRHFNLADHAALFIQAAQNAMLFPTSSFTLRIR